MVHTLQHRAHCSSKLDGRRTGSKTLHEVPVCVKLSQRKASPPGSGPVADLAGRRRRTATGGRAGQTAGGNPGPGIELLIGACHKSRSRLSGGRRTKGRGESASVRDWRPRSRPRSRPCTGEGDKRAQRRGLPLESCRGWCKVARRLGSLDSLSNVPPLASSGIVRWGLSSVGDHRWRRHSRGHRPGPKCGFCPFRLRQWE